MQFELAQTVHNKPQSQSCLAIGRGKAWPRTHPPIHLYAGICRTPRQAQRDRQPMDIATGIGTEGEERRGMRK